MEIENGMGMDIENGTDIASKRRHCERDHSVRVCESNKHWTYLLRLLKHNSSIGVEDTICHLL